MDRKHFYVVGTLLAIFSGLLLCYYSPHHTGDATVEQLQGVYHVKPGIYENDTLGATITLWPDGRCLVENLPVGMSSRMEIVDNPDNWDKLFLIGTHSTTWERPTRYNFIGYWRPIHRSKYNHPSVELTTGDSTFCLKNDNEYILRIFYHYDENQIKKVIDFLWGSVGEDCHSIFCLPRVSSFD